MQTSILQKTSTRKQQSFREIALFVVVGMMNTGIDLLTLNLLVLATHRHDGLWLVSFNCISFLAAVVNSYLLNGRLTFRRYSEQGVGVFIRFFIVSIIGLILNDSIVWLLARLLMGSAAVVVVINLSKLMATTVSLCWNYIAMRKWVFKRTIEDTLPVVSITDQEQQVAIHNAKQIEEISV